MTTLSSSTSGARRQWAELAVIFGFWTVLAVMTATHRALDPYLAAAREGAPVEVVLLRPILQFLGWAVLTPVIFWISRRLPLLEPNLRWPRIAQHFAIAVAIAVVFDIYDDILRVSLLGGRLPEAYAVRPPNPLRDILRLGFLNELTIYFAILAAGFARDYFIRYRARQEETIQLRAEAVQLQAQLAEARLEALRMQINPHFLFNTLHAVSSLVGRDPKGVRRMIARLSSLLRYTLDGSSAQQVPLYQELGFLDGYLEIQEIRFQGRLTVEQHIDPALHDALVPNLILQPLVENAIKHGVNQADGHGEIEIEARREGHDVVLRVRDNGPGLTEDELIGGDGAPVPAGSDGGVGLRNTRERLRALYGDRQSLTLANADAGGLVAEIRLPFHKASDLQAVAVEPS